MRSIWVCHAIGRKLPTGRIQPRAIFARELSSGRELTKNNQSSAQWLESIVVAFPAHQVLELLTAYGFSEPQNVIDLYAEHRSATNGRVISDNTADPVLAEACKAWGVPCAIGETDEETTDPEDGLRYCRNVVDTVSLLLRAIPCDWSQALRRGQYAAAVAAMQSRGIPVSLQLQTQAQQTRDQLLAIAEEEYPQCLRKGRWANDTTGRWLRGLGLGQRTNPSIDWCRRHTDSRVRRAGEIAKALEKLEKLSRCTIDGDSRSRVDLRPYAAITGRNQPRGYAWEIAKPLIQPCSGKVVAIVDYAQQEFGIAANLAGDSAMIGDYYTGDAYRNFGVRAGMCHRGDDDEGVRATLKRVVLPIMYGSSAESLRRAHGLSHASASDLVTGFAKAYPQYKQWIQDARSEMAQAGRISTAFGWHLYAPINSPDDFSKLLRTAGNFPVQATATEILWETCRLLKSAGVALCGTLHDAVLVEADEDSTADVIRQTEAAMAQASETVLGMPLRTSSESIRHGERLRSQERFWSSINSLLSVTAEACR
jgi:DNA polymerase-1